jgi:hypothetical protein
MTQYENRVNQTKKVYTNLAASYNAYYDAYTTLVGYEAGLSGYDETSITNAYNALKTQYDAMTVFTGYKGTGTASFGSAATQPSGYTHLLYANGSADTGYNFSFKVSSIPTVGFEWAYWAYFFIRQPFFSMTALLHQCPYLWVFKIPIKTMTSPLGAAIQIPISLNFAITGTAIQTAFYGQIQQALKTV